MQYATTLEMGRARSSSGALEWPFVYFFFLLLPFEDSVLQATPLGYAGAAASVLPLLAIMVKRFIMNPPPRLFVVYLAYALAVSCFFALFYEARSAVTLIDRGSRSFLLYTLYVYAFLYFKSTRIGMRRPVVLLGGVVLASMVIGAMSHGYLDGTSIFHYNASTNFRPRGFSIEASMYGYLVVASILLVGWFYEWRLAPVLMLALAAAVLVQSKGAISALAVSVVIYLLLRRTLRISLKLLLLVPLLVGAAFLLPLVEALYASDIDSYTSVATRSTMALLSVYSLVHSPFGHGFTGYLPFINEHGMEVVNFLNHLSPVPLNMSEVDEYFKAGNYKSVGAKSLLFDSMIYLGLPFLFCVYRILRKDLSPIAQSGSQARAILAYFTIISLAFYIPGVGSYLSAAALGLCFNKHVSSSRP